jgi:hypothetical protein
MLPVWSTLKMPRNEAPAKPPVSPGTGWNYLHQWCRDDSIL